MKKEWAYMVKKNGAVVGHANTPYGAKRTARRNGAKLYPETAAELYRDGIYRSDGECLSITELSGMMPFGAAVDAYNSIGYASFFSCFLTESA